MRKHLLVIFQLNFKTKAFVFVSKISFQHNRKLSKIQNATSLSCWTCYSLKWMNLNLISVSNWIVLQLHEAMWNNMKKESAAHRAYQGRSWRGIWGSNWNTPLFLPVRKSVGSGHHINHIHSTFSHIWGLNWLFWLLFKNSWWVEIDRVRKSSNFSNLRTSSTHKNSWNLMVFAIKNDRNWNLSQAI